MLILFATELYYYFKTHRQGNMDGKYNMGKSSKSHSNMRKFLELSAETSDKIKKLDGYVDEFKSYTLSKQNSVLTDKEEQKVDNKLKAIDKIVMFLSSEIKIDIEKQQEETRKMAKFIKNNPGANGISVSEVEMRELHTFKHGNDLSKALRNYQNMQCSYKESEKDRLKEIYLVANPEATEEDIKNLNDESKCESLLASAFALGSHSAKGILEEANNRKAKIEQIVKLINSLVTLIDEIDNTVRKNGKIIDKISLSVASSDTNTSHANSELRKALAYERKAMYIKRIIAAIIVICIVGFFAWIFMKIDKLHKADKNTNTSQS